MDRAEKARKVLELLAREFPNPKTALDFSTPLELLIATILSAQTTDERVNKTTPELFRRFRTAADYADARREEIEKLISSINFYRNKTKSIIACCRKIVDKYNGRVPDTLEGLTELPGVGRKTANIVLGNAFGKYALAVDTHVKRVAQRLGLTKEDNPDDIERDLCSIIPKRMWTKATHLLIFHGRKTCRARGPLCGECSVRRYCDYYGSVSKQSKKSRRRAQ